MSKLSISSVRRSADAPPRGAAPKSTRSPRHDGGLSLGRAERLGHRVDQLPGALTVQTKLTLGPAGDSYEQEADSVAKEVMGQIDSAPVAESAGGDGGAATAQRDIDEMGAMSSVQRMGDELEDVEASSVQRMGDELEDVEASSVQRMGDELEDVEASSVQRMGDELEDVEASSVQRMDDELDEGGLATVQRDAMGSLEGGAIDTSTESSIEAARGSGGEIAEGVRGSMEQAFGANFGGVRVHTDNQADTLNRQLNARAFTTGQDIFFRQGEYQPESRGGQELLAHELTHVVQQNGDAVRQGGGE